MEWNWATITATAWGVIAILLVLRAKIINMNWHDTPIGGSDAEAMVFAEGL